MFYWKIICYISFSVFKHLRFTTISATSDYSYGELNENSTIMILIIRIREWSSSNTLLVHALLHHLHIQNNKRDFLALVHRQKAVDSAIH